jgi:hypothetical protein
MRHPALLLLGVLVANPALALRCGSDLVSEGSTTFELTQRCGSPVSVERVEGRTANQAAYDARGNFIGLIPQSISDPYEIWTYNFGPSNFIARIIIRNGRIFKIEQGGYGY